MKQKFIKFDGKSLRVEDVYSVATDKDASVAISDKSLEDLRKGHEYLMGEVGKKVIYGVNTGFGPMASHLLAPHQLEQLQANLARSHAVGMGTALENEFVVASMAVRLNTLLKGYSGVSMELAKYLQIFINQRIVPVIPEHGGVGASGDLVQLAHIAIALMGEGEVFYRGERQTTRRVLRLLKLKPYRFRPKEALSIINGTSAMAGIGSILSMRAKRLVSIAIRNAAMALEVARAHEDAISAGLHILRPHAGQAFVAKKIRELLSDSKRLRNRDQFKDLLNKTNDIKEIPKTVQEIYSLRCVPQILGPVYEAWQKSVKDLETEINSVTDNPVVDWEKRLFYHGGNFHGDQIAVAIDYLKFNLVKLTMLSERRINFLLNHNVNHFFPPFLNLQKPGLTLALQGLQFVATSTTAQSQSLSIPHSIHSIPTNADNQDIVSMGTDACLMLDKVIDNAFIVLAIELISLCQAVDILKKIRLCSNSSQWLYRQLRNLLPKIENDRVLDKELAAVVKVLQNDSRLDLKF